jgi:SAM-dependent methyltransferase
MIANLSIRSTLAEKMDDPSVSPIEVRKALGELETINHWLGGYNVVLSALNSLPWTAEPLSIMDIGCGGGDTLRYIADWAEANNRQVNLVGVDINPKMVEYAAHKSQGYANVEFKVKGAFDDSLLLEQPDIVINSLFCHHFDDEALVALIQRMNKIAKKHVIINDLHRHWFAYHSIKAITNLFSKTYLVKYDAPLSVARALTKNEWVQILQKAGIKNFSIKWMWAWRWRIMIHTGEQH